LAQLTPEQAPVGHEQAAPTNGQVCPSERDVP